MYGGKNLNDLILHKNMRYFISLVQKHLKTLKSKNKKLKEK